jgi:hypothetical protein
MSLVLPPRFVAAPTGDVYDLSLSDVHFRTLTRLRGLAWKTRGERTPPLTIEELVAICGLDRSNIFRHLRARRVLGCIRIEPVGNHQFIVCPLCWESGSAVPTDERMGEFTEDEWKALFGDTDQSPGTQPVLASGPGRQPSRKDATDSRKDATQHVHVVVDSHDSGHEKQQQHVVESQKCDSKGNLLSDLAAVLVACGGDEDKSCALAGQLLAAHGSEVCDRQLAVFERRRQIALASRRGLQNPAGLLVDSIRGDWDPPPDEVQREDRRWFTDEEAEQFFVH